jgi:N-acetylneuraminate synthase
VSASRTGGPASHTGGPASRTYVIAEAGVNHGGDAEIATRLVDAAADAHADAVKFQSFRADDLVTPDAPAAAYQRAGVGASRQREMLVGLELSPEAHESLAARAAARGIDFLSTPFDLGSLRLLTERLGLRTIKIGSGDLTNAPLLLAAARAADRLIVSTGMATLEEVRDAVGVVAFGFVGRGAPSRAAFADAARSAEGRDAVAARLTLLQCTSAYPAPAGDVDLRAMATLREACGCAVGYSDHTLGRHVALAAVALGASALEKHLTLDRSARGPDHAVSLEPAEFAAMVREIREVEAALGTGRKAPAPSERDVAAVARRSLVAARAIRAGAVIVHEDVAVKRPGSGRTPMDAFDAVGRVATRDHAPEDPLELA